MNIETFKVIGFCWASLKWQHCVHYFNCVKYGRCMYGLQSQIIIKCTIKYIHLFMYKWNERGHIKGHWTSEIPTPTFYPPPQIVGIFIPLEVLAWAMTACWVLHSRLIYFWRNINISCIFYFLKSTSIKTQYSSLWEKSTSINTQYSSLWDTLEMMLFTKYLIRWKHIGRISWKFWYWFNIKSSTELDVKKKDVILVQCPFK